MGTIQDEPMKRRRRVHVAVVLLAVMLVGVLVWLRYSAGVAGRAVVTTMNGAIQELGARLELGGTPPKGSVVVFGDSIVGDLQATGTFRPDSSASAAMILIGRWRDAKTTTELRSDSTLVAMLIDRTGSDRPVIVRVAHGVPSRQATSRGRLYIGPPPKYITLY